MMTISRFQKIQILKKTKENPNPAYALKSDDGKTNRIQYPKKKTKKPNPAYALKSDDGETKPIQPLPNQHTAKTKLWAQDHLILL